MRIELGNGYPDLKIGTEVLLFAAQEQAISTNYVKQTMWKPPEQIILKIGESVQHLVSGCGKLARKEYKRQCANVAKNVHWDLCRKNGLEHTEK